MQLRPDIFQVTEHPRGQRIAVVGQLQFDTHQCLVAEHRRFPFGCKGQRDGGPLVAVFQLILDIKMFDEPKMPIENFGIIVELLPPFSLLHGKRGKKEFQPPFVHGRKKSFLHYFPSSSGRAQALEIIWVGTSASGSFFFAS